ncbi:uncharacterized protein A4U43_C08F27250 [Asparagus officinalis]|uniref:uncharacterized protein LOC109821669 n=1 Tax=Asparagus officinalis TaxID=4686 RepID=UPI00098E5FC2|nr:uncharacterized protein LOC109821669 [Asparagus officinalis]ONK61200.1 uncharacterized protein A4U43_C08F27250 [Asparagus officinalis]
MTLELKPKYCSHKRSIIDRMNGGGNNTKKKKRSQRLLLLLALALGVAMVSVMLLTKLRQGRVLGLLLQDQEREISALQLVLLEERKLEGNENEMGEHEIQQLHPEKPDDGAH